jgi:4-hydroxybenzoate polyprenyltransferase
MPARSFISALFYSIRPSACIGISLFAVAAIGRWDDISVIILTFISAFIGGCGCFLINDIFDREKDLKNNKLRPIATGEIPVRTAFAIAVICCLVMLILSVFLSFNTFILSILLIAGFWLYPFINQHFGLFSNIWVSVCSALAFIYGALVYDLTPLIYLATFFTFFVNIGREILLDALDTKGDHAVGKPSIPIAYGEKGTVIVVSVFFSFASLTVIGYLLYFPTTWPWMCALLLLLWAPFFMKKNEGFRKWALFNIRLSHLLFLLLIVLLFVKPADKKTVPPNITAEYCLDKLEQLQSKKDGFYQIGMFPTKRFWVSKKGSEDNSIFANAIIAYILRTVNERHPNPKNLSMLNKAIEPFELYRNRHKEASYNYWQTVGEALPFPNSILLSLEKYRLPDDFDDTALIQLSRGPHPMDQPVRDKMLKYAMRPQRKAVSHSPVEDNKKMVYETWYADKMQQELDVVVMSNVMLFVIEKGYAFETTDRHTIDCLKNVIDEGQYTKDPIGYAPYYNRPAIILYSLARLLTSDKKGEFTAQRQTLIKQLRQALNETDQCIEKIMIATSLLRLGESVDLELSSEKLIDDAKSFAYSSVIYRIIPSFYWRSEAVSWALTYEFFSFNPTIHWK